MAFNHKKFIQLSEVIVLYCINMYTISKSWTVIKLNLHILLDVLKFLQTNSLGLNNLSDLSSFWPVRTRKCYVPLSRRKVYKRKVEKSIKMTKAWTYPDASPLLFRSPLPIVLSPATLLSRLPSYGYVIRKCHLRRMFRVALNIIYFYLWCWLVTYCNVVFSMCI